MEFPYEDAKYVPYWNSVVVGPSLKIFNFIDKGLSFSFQSNNKLFDGATTLSLDCISKVIFLSSISYKYEEDLDELDYKIDSSHMRSFLK